MLDLSLNVKKWHRHTWVTQTYNTKRIHTATSISYQGKVNYFLGPPSLRRINIIETESGSLRWNRSQLNPSPPVSCSPSNPSPTVVIPQRTKTSPITNWNSYSSTGPILTTMLQLIDSIPGKGDVELGLCVIIIIDSMAFNIIISFH